MILRDRHLVNIVLKSRSSCVVFHDQKLLDCSPPRLTRRDPGTPTAIEITPDIENRKEDDYRYNISTTPISFIGVVVSDLWDVSSFL